MATWEKRDNYEEITLLVPSSSAAKLRMHARRYRTSPGGMLNIILSYYFGDGSDHLRCEHCAFAEGYSCAVPWMKNGEIRQEGQEEPPYLLDKGTVVVGLSTGDLGKQENGKLEVR